MVVGGQLSAAAEVTAGTASEFAELWGDASVDTITLTSHIDLSTTNLADNTRTLTITSGTAAKPYIITTSSSMQDVCLDNVAFNNSKVGQASLVNITKGISFGENVSISFAYSTGNGGAVNVAAGGQLTVAGGSVFEGNVAKGCGGAISVADQAAGSTPSLILQSTEGKDITFRNNQSEATGSNGSYLGNPNDVYLGKNASMKLDTAAGSSITFGGGIESADASASIVKTGEGTTNLGDGSFYAGTLTVKEGTAVLSATWGNADAAPATIVEAEGGLELQQNAQLYGSLTSEGALIVTGDSTIAGPVTLGGEVLFSASCMKVQETLTLGESVTFIFTGYAAQDEAYLLVDNDQSFSGNVAAITLKGDDSYQYLLSVKDNDIYLSVVLNGNDLTWLNAKKTVWQLAAGGWADSEGSTAVFSDGDKVTFADGSVTIVGLVAPGEVTICTNKSLAFKTKYDKKTQQYSGAIAGETSVTIDAAPKAKVTMNDGNTYSGGTIIECGSVKAGGATSFGTGTITLNGGTLDLAGKAVDNAIALEGAAIIKGGAKYTGDFSMGSGADLMKGSVVNIAAGKTVTLSGGAINGTLSGLGSIEVTGDVELGATGKLTTSALAVESGTFSIGSKGLALSAKNSILTVNGGVVDSEGKLSTNELQMTGGEISIDTAKAMSLDIKGKTTSSRVDNGKISIAGKMSVAGNLELAGAASIRLYDPSGKNKAMPLAVKGTLTLGSGSTLTLSGALSARDMVLNGGTINLTSNKPLTIKVGNRLDINGPVDLNLGFAVADKDVNKKSFKILTFKSSNLGDAGELYDLLGLSDSYCTLSFDKKKTSVMLTVTDKEAWDAYIADEETAAPTATTALVNPALPDYSGVADALVQANWGLVESIRAFVNTIANRSMAVQLGSGERAVWASAIAGSSRRSSSGTHGGADTNITGGAIGMETQVGEGSLLGMALGNSWTRVSAHNYGSIKQDTTHLGLYGQTNWNKLSADWSAAYGRSESKFNGSDWSQRAIQLDGRLSYNHALSETVLLRGFGGVQYYASDSARVDGIDTGEVQNLRGEIGVGIVRSTYKSSVYAELALHQDLVRDNPEVRSPFGLRYHGTNPGRTGINLTIGGSYALSDQWSVNASYTAEVVENANAHSVNVGATYKF